MSTNSKFISVCKVLLVLIVMAACGPKPTDVGGEMPPNETQPPAESQTAPAPDSESAWLLDWTVVLDPAILMDDDALAVCGLLYDGLVELDASSNPSPSLAVHWTVSDDALDYIFELRPNVTFTSGELFNADAVLANFNRWFDPASPLRGEGEYAGWLEYFMGFKGDLDASQIPVSQFDGIEKVDDLTVLIHLNRPEPNLLSYLAQPFFYMIDPGVLGADGSAYGSRDGSVSGTGAYNISTWDEEGIVLSPSDTYWGEKAAEKVKVGWR
jgi:peptide/nickel transport system substrate-binding protein